jgi:hypothetical protein
MHYRPNLNDKGRHSTEILSPNNNNNKTPYDEIRGIRNSTVGSIDRDSRDSRDERHDFKETDRERESPMTPGHVEGPREPKRKRLNSSNCDNPLNPHNITAPDRFPSDQVNTIQPKNKKKIQCLFITLFISLLY